MTVKELRDMIAPFKDSTELYYDNDEVGWLTLSLTNPTILYRRIRPGYWDTFSKSRVDDEDDEQVIGLRINQ